MLILIHRQTEKTGKKEEKRKKLQHSLSLFMSCLDRPFFLTPRERKDEETGQKGRKKESLPLEMLFGAMAMMRRASSFKSAALASLLAHCLFSPSNSKKEKLRGPNLVSLPNE